MTDSESTAGDPHPQAAPSPDVDGGEKHTRYEPRLAASAMRDLDRASVRVTGAVIEFIFGPLALSPHRLGKPLRGDLDGLWSARRGDYRILYRIERDPPRLTVIKIAHRSVAYRPR